MIISVFWMEVLRMGSLALCAGAVLFLIGYLIKDMIQGEVW
jgi:hypothetical protein